MAFCQSDVTAGYHHLLELSGALRFAIEPKPAYGVFNVAKHDYDVVFTWNRER